MKLITYINMYYSGNKTAFATAMGVHAPQIHAWLNNGAEVIGGKLVTKCVTLPPVPDFTAQEVFEALVLERTKSIPLDKRADGKYESDWVRGAFAGFTMAGDEQDAAAAARNLLTTQVIDSLRLLGSLGVGLTHVAEEAVESSKLDDEYF